MSLNEQFIQRLTFDTVEYSDKKGSRNVKYAEITGYTGCCEKLEIPGEIDGIQVKAIAHGAFYGCKSLKSVILPDGVRDICFDAFYGCSGLESIRIPESVTYIGNRAFCGCTSLKSVSIPQSVEIIGEKAVGYDDINAKTKGFTVKGKKLSAAYKYASANSLDFEKNGKSEMPFTYSVEVMYDASGDKYVKAACITNYCGDNDNVTVPDKIDGYAVKIIDGCAFAQTSVKKVVIPDGTEKILSGAFRGCKSLERIILPDTLELIGSYAFSGCDRLKSVSIPKNTKVGEMAFDSCA
ncbi:leucine-rich repeat domain-containing protein [Ruminococcus sp. Marseille-P6503]|uniref:leucine-rich repeat domain-containing protein n=1 Tax=Ruminococcus sp. Marseille-P6503 TaxID=2364796 RepID=UPI000F51C43A|nr:leucine-rich repeat domain-containing protein [Ruminococcus sp. Marseille-P6503]